MRCRFSGLGEGLGQDRDRRAWRGRLDALCARRHEEPNFALHTSSRWSIPTDGSIPGLTMTTAANIRSRKCHNFHISFAVNNVLNLTPQTKV
ncbi:hypothetical protein CDAR_606191 [Caerostris darwini]|uniref:Uncharacterized protein n=1 Tax=Caerostris darwini TaxID=1538125 RepID=A0AAV4NQV5_9ARAC|nr:hypothetical protein CDAR_606191 [Caerostris darwini]